METIKNLLKARKNYLIQLKEEKEKALEATPEGALRICAHGNKTQYYLRNDPKDFSGVYIREKDVVLAQKLAQKDYDKKILCSVEKELKVVSKCLLNYPTVEAEHIYETLHRERQKLITPIMETEEQFVYKWENVQYQGKEMDESIPEIYTSKGERVRSKSEVIIADILNSEGIPYRYEYPIQIKEWGKVYPDFTVLNVSKRKEIYWEHFGMMDDAVYIENALQKITAYAQNGIIPGKNLIITYETKKNPINQKVVRLMIQEYLK
ncbi:MAG: hypothetical protein E7291_03285 [Lachnospiraceae bacterium]|nr:hypothetical protein [Lachnospiraceae bacterium]